MGSDTSSGDASSDAPSVLSQEEVFDRAWGACSDVELLFGGPLPLSPCSMAPDGPVAATPTPPAIVVDMEGVARARSSTVACRVTCLAPTPPPPMCPTSCVLACQDKWELGSSSSAEVAKNQGSAVSCRIDDECGGSSVAAAGTMVDEAGGKVEQAGDTWDLSSVSLSPAPSQSRSPLKKHKTKKRARLWPRGQDPDPRRRHQRRPAPWLALLFQDDASCGRRWATTRTACQRRCL